MLVQQSLRDISDSCSSNLQRGYLKGTGLAFASWTAEADKPATKGVHIPLRSIECYLVFYLWHTGLATLGMVVMNGLGIGNITSFGQKWISNLWLQLTGFY